MNKWQELTSLQWYDQAIEFLFRFTAKTCEPLLAAGLTVSAADYLSHGAVMAGHPAFSLAWAWTQALALESSSGVVFVYGLQAFRQSDNVKGALYLALALLLAIVGGGMLLMQVNVMTMGNAESAVPVLNVLRVVVSIAYIFLLRAKNIRFTDLADISAQPAPAQVTVSEPGETHLQLAAPANDAKIDAPIYRPRFESKELVIKDIMQRQPGASPEEVAQAAGCTVRTATKWVQKLAAKE